MTSQALHARLKKSGFSLVLSLAVMAMLLLLCVGGAALLSIQLRVAQASVGFAKAKLNAMVGARIALGELQRLAGPDQRATATATILCKPGETNPLQSSYYAQDTGTIISHPRWVGVWNSGKAESSSGARTSFLERSQEGYLQDTRGDWKMTRTTSRRLLGWMVSGNEASPPMTGGSKNPAYLRPDDPFSRSDVNYATLLGSGTLGSRYNASASDTDMLGARVPIVKIPESQSGGGFAYWVADEGVKAKLNGVDRNTDDAGQTLQPDKTNPLAGGYARLLLSQRGNMGMVRYPNEDISAPSHFPFLNNLKQVQIGAITSFSDYASYDANASVSELAGNLWHDVGFYSRSVFSDPVNGGLKRDLTAYLLGKNTAASAGFPGVKDDDSLLSTVEADGSLTSIPPYKGHTPTLSFLKNWALTSALPWGTSIAPTVEPGVSDASNPLQIQIPDFSKVGTGPNAQNTPKFAEREPILTQAILYHQPARLGSDDIGYAIAPVITLWNPYPVDLQINNLAVAFHGRLKFQFNITYYDSTKQPQTRFGSFGEIDSNKALPKLAYIIPGMTLKAGESMTFSAPQKPVLVDYTKYFNASDTVDTSAMLAPITPGSSFFFYSFKTGPDYTSLTPGGSSGAMKAPQWQEVLNWYQNPPPGTNAPVWRRSANLSFSAAANASSSTPFYATMLRKTNAPKALRLWDSSDHSVSTGYLDGGWMLVDGNANNIGIQDLNSTPAASAMSGAVMNYQCLGMRMLTVDEQQLPPAGGSLFGATLAANTNFNGFVQFNFRALKSSRFPTDAATQIRASSVNGGGLFRYSPSPKFFGAVTFNSQNLPLIDKSNLTIASSFVLADVVWQPWGVYSLGKLQSCPLTPMLWHPARAVGNSYASPSVHVDRSAEGNTDENTAWTNSIQKGWNWDTSRKGLSAMTDYALDYPKLASSNPLFLYDSSFEFNHALFDTWMVSSIRDQTQGWAAQEIWSLEKNSTLDSRLIPVGTPSPDAPLFAPAAGLLCDGAFNVNSTSKAAWVALLASTRGLNVPGRNSSLSNGNTTPFPRVDYPSEAIAATASTKAYDEATWNGTRTLTDKEIDTLAGYIVDEVKTRGPFLSLADFINRRLAVPGSDQERTWPYEGTLQAAIDKTSSLGSTLNSKLDQGENCPESVLFRSSADVSGSGGNGPNYYNLAASSTRSVAQQHRNRASSKLVGAAGYLTQADILQHLGNAISSRSDTFTIRVKGTDDATGAEAYIECVVQRMPEALIPEANRYTPKHTATGEQRFGRRIRIIFTRWIDSTNV